MAAEKTQHVELVETDLAGRMVVSVPVETYRAKEMFFGRIIFSGLDWGDIVAALKNFNHHHPDGDWAAWNESWQSRARFYEENAEQAKRNGWSATQCHWAYRAAACHHFSELFYFDNPPVKEAARQKVTDHFLSVIDLFPEKIEKATVMYDDIEMPVYHMHPSAPGNGPQPYVIMINGADSAKEVELYTFARSFVQRGLGVILFDGPGQGELLGHTAQVVEYEKVFEKILRYTQSLPRVDVDRIGVFGVSFGGYLSARVASAYQDELQACINLSGGYDHDELPTSPPLLQKDFQYLFHVGKEEMDRLALEELHLRDHKPLEIPLLCIHATEDRIIPYDSCERMMEWADGPKELLKYEDHGHVCVNHFNDLIPRFADWMADNLQAAAPARQLLSAA